MRPTFSLVAFLSAVMVLSACTVMRPLESAATRTVTPTEAVSLGGQLTPANTAIPRKSKDRVSILALSGGGSDGAYGVGVLNGWTQSGQRPEFDIVTGVSTGALMSVFAFLGPQYDNLLRTLYVNQTADNIFIDRGIRGLLADSLFDNSPLKKQIEKHVTSGVLDAIAAEHAKGRRLYVATTNLDANVSVVWDMGLIASEGGDGRANSLQLFQKVLRASAAIPVAFPPVYIKPLRGVQLRQAHVDGGVKTPVLLSDFLFEQKARDRDLYIIVNGPLELQDASQPVAASVQAIGTKAVSGLTRELTQQTLYRGYVRAQNTGTRFQLTAIPKGVSNNPSPLNFDRDYLEKIYNLGVQRVQRPGFWWTSPPTLRRFDRVARR